MAGFPGVLTYPETVIVATQKTLLQLVAPTHQRLKIKEVSISFQGIANTDPPLSVDLLFQTSAGTMTALSPTAEDTSLPEAIQATGQRDATAEPTAGNLVKSWEIHPQSGVIWQPALGDELIVGGANRLGLRLNASSGGTPKAKAYIRYEE